ncbi:MAG: EamA/RhaT family transporter [Hyphomicrobiales bacterium]|nr:MAG: EamA/RhaT family transporter [Hyphomicrobiales bacterium]
MPLFFSSNLIFGRVAISTVEPWTLATLRWTLAFLVLLPFAWRGIIEHRQVFRDNWTMIVMLGLLSMWICGALVYFALRYTTATNGTLIYTSSPVLIVLLEWAFRGRRISPREALGIVTALVGVVMIVVKGDLDTLLGLRFNVGDIIFAIAAISWAAYSVLLKRGEFSSVPTLSMFAVIAAAGAATLFPFMIWESIEVGTFPTDAGSWSSIAGIVIFSSVLAFSCFQYGIKVVGPAITGMFMYLLPPYGVMMAVLFLGETLRPFHFAGFVLIMTGLLLGTLPKDIIRRIRNLFGNVARSRG